MLPCLDIVIVNWNSGVHLRECVDSVIKYKHTLVNNVFVIDNGSTDGSENLIMDLPNVSLIRVGENLGFGKACNLGAKHSKNPYLLFLNPDAALYSETLPKALTYMQDPANINVGICGVQLLNESGCISKSSSRFPSVMGFTCHALGCDRLFPRLGHLMREWDHAHTCEVDQVIGAFFMVRRCLFEAVEGFDERFFVYFEEVDFSYRAKQLGWSSVYLADAQAFHAGGGTSNQIKARRLFYSLRSRLLYASKHFTLFGAILVMFVTLLVEPLSRSVISLFRRSLAGFYETWVGYGMLCRWLLQCLFKGLAR
jgi:GT2 family glycosyltransferase